MNFLKRLFGGGAAPQRNPSLDLYVRPKRCTEIVHLRIDLYNDLSLNDDGQYYVRKLARATRCPFPAEVELYFDKNRKMLNSEVTDGELVTAAEYETWVAGQPH